MTILIRRGSYSVVNQSAIPTLFKHVEKGQTSNTTKAQQNAGNSTKLLSIIAKHSPALFKPHVALLTKIIAGEKKGNLAELALMALANVARADEKTAATTDKCVCAADIQDFQILMFSLFPERQRSVSSNWPLAMTGGRLNSRRDTCLLPKARIPFVRR